MHSLRIGVSTKSSISQLECIFHFSIIHHTRLANIGFDENHQSHSWSALSLFINYTSCLVYPVSVCDHIICTWYLSRMKNQHGPLSVLMWLGIQKEKTI